MAYLSGRPITGWAQSKKLPQLTTKGSQIYAGDKPIRLRGANIPDPLFINLWRSGVNAKDLVKRVKSMGGNVVRIAVHPHIKPKEAFFKDRMGYFNRHLKPTLNECEAQAIYCIIDLHFVADYESRKTQALFFWAFMVEHYANESHVIFEIYNEPIKPDNWARWKNYVAQPVVDLIRKSGAQNLLIVGGPNYNQSIGKALHDPIDGINIAYSAHIYPNTDLKMWDRAYLPLAKKFPLLVTEWGFQTGHEKFLAGTKTSFGVPLIKWMDQHQIGWTAWVLDNQWTSQMVDHQWRLTKGENGLGQFVADQLKR